MTYPTRWASASGRELFALVTSGSRGWARHYSNDGAAFVRMGNLDHNTIEIDLADLQRVQPPAGAEGARTKLQANDIVVSITAELGMVGLVPDSLGEAYINQHLALVRPSECLHSPFLAWFLASAADGKAQLLSATRGATKASLGLDDIRGLQIPVAPLPEQQRIARRLQAFCIRVEACSDRLDCVSVMLKEFRQAVLRNAITGALTEDWRSASGESRFPWQVSKIGSAGNIQLGRQRSPKFHQGINMRPYLRVQNVFEAKLDLSDVMEMDFSPEDFEKYQLHPGDILLNEGQSPQFLGRPAIYRGELPGACFTNTLIRFQAHSHVLPEFALLVFRHHMHSGRYVAEGNITTNIAHLGAGRFAEVEFPIPTLEEQTEIVRRVESLLSLADTLEARLAKARLQVGHLMPALLAKAFRGELVPQDPNDEPASALLDRLRRSNAPDNSTPASRRRDRAPVV